MTAVLDPLLFKNYVESGFQEGRILTFARLLNNAFEQFQKLWNEYSESLKLSAELESSLSSVRLRLQSLEKENSTTCATCTKCHEDAGLKVPSISDNERTGTAAVHIDRLISNGTSKEEDIDSVLIFSQDNTDNSIEETSLNESISPLKEVQNIFHKRTPSPIVGSHRKNVNAIRRKFSDDPHSTNYMPELSDRTKIDTSGTKIRPKTASIQKSESSLPSEWHSNVSSKLKNTTKLGISTTQNVRTEIMLGTKRKLKQSQLSVTSEKINDLSYFDNAPLNKTDRYHMSIKPTETNLANESLIQENNSGSKHEKLSLASVQEKSKTREDLTEIEEHKWLIPSVKNLIRKPGSNSKRHKLESQPDTDITLFAPAETPGQYDYSLLEPNKSDTISKQKILVNSNSSRDGDPKSNKDNTVFIDFMAKAKLWTTKEFECGIKSQVKSPKKKSLSRKLSNEACQSDSSKMVGILSMENKSKHEFENKKKTLINDFNRLPKKQQSPNYVYQGSPVRKKAAKAQLNGWSCWECKNYYEAMGLKEEELRTRQNQCSRHRAKFTPKVSTQKGYWNPDFTSSFHSMYEEDE